MPEFHAIRIACCLAELWLISRRPGRWITALLLASAAFHAIPAAMFSPWWLRAVQTPLLAALLALSIAVSFSMFGWYDMRWHLLAAAVAGGCIPVLAGWLWNPENWYQAMMLVRQYAVIALATGFWLAWAWVRHLEPVEGQQAAPLGLWLLWLAAGIPEAISTKGGMLWAVLPWHDGLGYWRLANALALAVRLTVVIAWAVSLRQPSDASRDPRFDSRGLIASQ